MRVEKGQVSNLIEHAKYELKKAGLFDKDSDYEGMIGEAVMELIEKFSEQGHSGMSASIVANIFAELVMYKPLGGINGTPDEWSEVAENLLQNKRLGSVFKDSMNGKPYFLDAIIWVDKATGSGWNGTAELKSTVGLFQSIKIIHSRQYIKSFPFKPKTFYVEVGKNSRITEKGKIELGKALEYYHSSSTESFPHNSISDLKETVKWEGNLSEMRSNRYEYE
jgi:hypothetical protein